MWGEKRRGSIACVQSPPPLRKDRERGWGEGAAVLRLSEARCGERKWELTRSTNPWQLTTLRHSHLPDTKNPHIRAIQPRQSVRSDCVLLKLWSCMQTQQTQQLSLPEKLPGLSRNRPMARFDFHVQCNHLLARIYAFLTSSLTSLSPSSLPLKPPAILGSIASASLFC